MRYSIEIEPARAVRENAGTLLEIMDVIQASQGRVKITDLIKGKEIFSGPASRVDRALHDYANQQ